MRFGVPMKDRLHSFVMLHTMRTTNVHTVAIVTFIALLLAIGGYMWYDKNRIPDLVTYSNSSYGVSFQYPDDFELTETPMAQGNGTGTLVTILEKGTVIPRNGEGPTAIAIAMYEGAPAASRQQSPAQVWIANSPYSNFKLSQMTAPGKTEIGGQDGYLYTWDGLYQGTTVVTEHDGIILSFTVTYDGETDMEKREVFTDLVESVEFMERRTAATTTETL